MNVMYNGILSLEGLWQCMFYYSQWMCALNFTQEKTYDHLCCISVHRIAYSHMKVDKPKYC